MFEVGNIPEEKELDRNFMHETSLPTSFNGYALKVSRDYRRDNSDTPKMGDIPLGFTVILAKAPDAKPTPDSGDLSPLH